MIPPGVSDRPFDGEILGRPVWALADADAAADAVVAARAGAVGLIVYRGAPAEAEHLVAAGFRLVETLVTYECPLPPVEVSADLPPDIRLASDADADAVAAIARQAFRYDRWHADPAIPDARADAFKAAWARNAVLGRAVAVLIALGGDGRPAGFSALMAQGTMLAVDLIAVAPGQQGRGLGRALMAGAMAYGVGHKYGRLRVGTQAENAASIRLYEALGMMESARACTWHWTP